VINTLVAQKIGTLQIAFINPPNLKLNFTGAADVADFSLIDGAVRKVLLSLVNSILVLPNRILYKVDSSADFFKAIVQPLGVLRITADKAWGFAEEQEKSKTKKLFSKLTRASPDCYAECEVGAEPSWRTSIKNNTTRPAWGETHDFVVSDLEQCVKVTVRDHDVNSDDEVGVAVSTVRDVLAAGGKMELGLVHNGEETEGKVGLSCEYFEFTPKDGASFSASTHSGDGLISGILSVLIAGAFGIKGARETLHPSVVVTFGTKHRFQTAIQSDARGTDINNPTFDTQFRIPITSDMTSGSLRIACMDSKTEVGAVEVPFADLQKAEGMAKTDEFDVGNGVKVRASICLRGLQNASGQEATLLLR
jgi:Ca2+-dependent lipid-binding protein